MELTWASQLMIGITLLTVPTIQYGGTFLLSVLRGRYTVFNEKQKAFFRAGHAHAGVLVILSILAQLLVASSALPGGLGWAVRIAFPLSAILISGGFFGAGAGASEDGTRVGKLINLLWLGSVMLAAALLVLGIGLLLAL
jgi:hypothetical protein